MTTATISEPSTSTLILRPGRPEDAAECGRIAYEGFNAIASKHNFEPDFPNVDVAVGLMEMLFAHRDIYSVVAEKDGKIVGSNFLWEQGVIAGVGPITVDVASQDGTVGRQLMQDVLKRAEIREFAGVRLVQAGYHRRSLSLYAKLGFDVREPLACMNGTPPNISLPGRTVRAATTADIPACATVCFDVHGHNRTGELADGITQGTATVVECGGKITGYASAIGFFGHAVGRSTEDLMALIGGAKQILGPGFLLPTRNAELFRWCLANGLRVMQPETLMSKGLYNEPSGAFLPSILF